MRKYRTRIVQYVFEGKLQQAHVIPAMVDIWVDSCERNPKVSEIKVLEEKISYGKHKVK